MLHFFLAAVCLAQAPRVDSHPEDESTGTFLYFDYLEDGELRGGRVQVDPANPLHAEVDTPQQRPASASPVTTLFYSGPSENRVDLVFVGDGYTAGQLGQYVNDVNSVWPTFLAESPLDEYTNYFNIFRVDVVSPQSGVDNDPTNGIQRDTALDMGYWCSGIQRLLCVNVLKANTEARNAPGKDAVLAVANSATYGGAGYSNLGTLAGHNFSAIEIALHEFGHSFAGLADEYDYGGPSSFTGPEPSEADVTTYSEAEMLAMDRKWARWLDLPNVGFFEGAMYSRFGIFRPTSNSKMRNLGRPFEEVNSERFVRHLYRYVHPIDGATPAGNYPLDAQFFVVPLQPIGHDLDIQWSLDGAPIPGATSTSFDAAGLDLAFGPHELSVVVADTTPLVRNPNLLEKMKERRAWTLVGEHKARPGAAPGGAPDPVLALESSSGAGTLLEFRIARRADVRASRGLALIVVAPERSALSARALHFAARNPGVACLGWMPSAEMSGEAEDGALRVSARLPSSLALSKGTLYARALWIGQGTARGAEALWSDVLELSPGTSR